MQAENDVNAQIFKKLDNILAELKGIKKFLTFDDKKITISEPPENLTGFQALSKATDLDLEKLKAAFHIENNDVRILVNITVKSNPEKQFIATIIILTIYHYYFGIDSITSKSLNEKLKWLAIGSLSHLSNNLKLYKQYIIADGVTGSANYSYKITYPGCSKGVEIIKELLNQ